MVVQKKLAEGKDIDFEGTLWKAADKLRKKMEVHEYKYVVLGLIFLKSVVREKSNRNSTIRPRATLNPAPKEPIMLSKNA